MNQYDEGLPEEKKKQVEAILEREEFYDDPQRVFTNFTNSLPNSKQIWQLAFIWCFLLSNLAKSGLQDQRG